MVVMTRASGFLGNALITHGSLRLLNVACTLTQSIVLARTLSVADIGLYYLLATLAYVGSAAVFVGADTNLQRRVANLADDSLLPSGGALLRYAASTSLLGLLLVAFVSASFAEIAGVTSSATVIIACCAVSLSTYSISLYRNILLVSNRVVRSSVMTACDATAKLVVVCLAATFASNVGAVELTIAAAMGSSIALLALMLWGRVKDIRWPTAPLLPEKLSNQLERILPVSGSGLLNWAQMQGYRPLLAWLQAPMETVGTVALLVGLGSTAAMSCFAVVSQMHVPRLYASQGKDVRRYWVLTIVVALALALCAWPAGWLFLELTGKQRLLPYVGLVSVGVLLETCNALVGIALHRANAAGNSLWRLPLANGIACATTLVILLYVTSIQTSVWLVAAALAAGQLLVVILVWMPATLPLARRHA
jgi:O-antigen/teichoic acid export membrane protein